MRIIGTNQELKFGTMDECFRQMRDELGLDGAELSLYQEWALPHLRPEDVEAVKPAKEKHNFFLAGHIWEDLGAGDLDDVISRVLYWLDICRRTGIESMIAHGGMAEDVREGHERLRQVLARVLPAFEEAGVTLNLENVPDWADESGRRCVLIHAWEFLEVLPRFESPNLRFCLDTGHAHMVGGAGAFVEELAPWLNHIHVHDNDGAGDLHQGYGEGTFDWDSFLMLARDEGFDGTFSLEFSLRSRLQSVRRFQEDVGRIWS